MIGDKSLDRSSPSLRPALMGPAASPRPTLELLESSECATCASNSEPDVRPDRLLAHFKSKQAIDMVIYCIPWVTACRSFGAARCTSHGCLWQRCCGETANRRGGCSRPGRHAFIAAQHGLDLERCLHAGAHGHRGGRHGARKAQCGDRRRTLIAAECR